MNKPTFYSMTLRELADWVVTHNSNEAFCFDELPGIEDLDDDEEVEAREEYESMAEQLYDAGKDAALLAAIGPCG